jgi:hypothetical protein
MRSESEPKYTNSGVARSIDTTIMTLESTVSSLSVAFMKVKAWNWLV